MTLLDFNYWFNIALFVPAFLFQLGILITCFKTNVPFKILWFLSSTVGAVAIGSFLIAQVHWIVTGSNDALLNWIVAMWFVFDYTNSAFYLSISAASFFTLRIYNDRSKIVCSVAYKCRDKK